MAGCTVLTTVHTTKDIRAKLYYETRDSGSIKRVLSQSSCGTESVLYSACANNCIVLRVRGSTCASRAVYLRKTSRTRSRARVCALYGCFVRDSYKYFVREMSRTVLVGVRA